MQTAGRCVPISVTNPGRSVTFGAGYVCWPHFSLPCSVAVQASGHAFGAHRSRSQVKRCTFEHTPNVPHCLHLNINRWQGLASLQ